MDASLSPHYPAPQLHDGSIFHSTPYPPHPTLASQQDIGLDPFQFDPQLENQPEIEHPHQRSSFDQNAFNGRPRSQPARFHEIRSNAPPLPSSQQQNNSFASTQGGLFDNVIARSSQQQSTGEGNKGQFGVLSPHPQLLAQHLSQDEQLGRLQNELDIQPAQGKDGGATEGHFGNMKMDPNPPNLEDWREKLFNVDETITLTEDE